MGNINERFFREDMGLRNAPEYIDDLDMGAPFTAVARDYARGCVEKAVGALIQSHGWWKQSAEDTAKLTVDDVAFDIIIDDISAIANRVLSATLGDNYRVIDGDDGRKDKHHFQME